MATTYNVFITHKAYRLGQDLDKLLLANYPASERDRVRIITTKIDRSKGNVWSFPYEHLNRYIRIIIDVPRSRVSSPEHKKELLNKTVEACLAYQEKKAEKCEIEVKIDVYEEEDVARITSKWIDSY